MVEGVVERKYYGRQLYKEQASDYMDQQEIRL